jgi:hypothetical protein
LLRQLPGLPQELNQLLWQLLFDFIGKIGNFIHYSQNYSTGG